MYMRFFKSDILRKYPKNINFDFSSGKEERDLWINTIQKIAFPVLSNMANETLKKNMPVEYVKKERAKFAHLEAVGRLICGIAPWLELGSDKSDEGKLREKYINLTINGLKNVVNPESKDYLIFDEPYQPLVDSAHLAEGLLRGKNQIWNNLDSSTQDMLISALKKTRSIKPWVNNWILFPSMIEAFIFDVTGDCDFEKLNYGVNTYMNEWYCGDGHYGDGPSFHFDFYNSYVIHPMLTDILTILKKHNLKGGEFLDVHLKRLSHYSQQLERLISPEGAYPVIGRSMLYRTAVFQALGQASLMDLLPKNIKAPQVRCALTSVIKRQFTNENLNFDKNGWLRFGFNGKQVGIAEEYSNTGSLYLCSTGFLPLGLPPSHNFWSGSFTEWTSLKAWSGKEIKSDMYIKY